MSSPLLMVAKSVFRSLGGKTSNKPSRVAAVDKDAEWQRVNSYVADVLKDSHVLYAKLARLQGDFVGEELDRLMSVSEAVLAIGEELSKFSKAFYEGKLQMAENHPQYGNGQGGEQSPGQGGGELPTPDEAAPSFKPFGKSDDESDDESDEEKDSEKEEDEDEDK
jgi:hypothetical protein